MVSPTNLEQRATWLLGILDSAIALATADLTTPVAAMAEDAETVNAALPEKRQQDLKNFLESWLSKYQAGVPVERESTVGLDQIEADLKIHTMMEEKIREIEPDAIVVGEEASPQAWDRWEEAAPGAIIYSLDAIDGSAPYDSLCFGFSTNLLMYVRQQDGTDALMLAIVLNSSRLGLVFITPNSVSPAYCDKRLDLLTEPAFPEDAVRHGYCALVAATPPRRMLAAPFLDTTASWGLPDLSSGKEIYSDPPLTVFTLGGAPATWGIAMGRLDAFICPFAQTVHDTAGIPALLALGLKAFGPGGVPYETKDLMARFNQLARPDKTDAYQPVPPLVIARDEDLAIRIAERFLADGKRHLVMQPVGPSDSGGLSLVPS